MSIQDKNKNLDVLIDIKNLKQYFHIGRGKVVKAVDDVSFQIYRGETFGLVGESGCGKTTCGRTILRIYQPTAGEVSYRGQNVSHLRRKALADYRKKTQMIFQDPYSSLDPRMTVEEIVAEGLRVHFPKLSAAERTERVISLLEVVGLTKDHATRFPHELSGGQRQRIGVARALAVEPEFIVCDEPISALDVSIQAQVVNLLKKLQRENDLTYLFISHDLSMVKHISDRIGVMYLGSLVEVTSNHQLYDNPLHPYTKALISAIPIPDPSQKDMQARIKLEGEIPSPINTPPGCKFCSRCPYRMKICQKAQPPLREIEAQHYAACYLFEQCRPEQLTSDDLDHMRLEKREDE